MKKTLTINLNGTVYHIDEDAYQMLSTYLDNLRQHFRKTQGADEIIQDMESRISEIFNEDLGNGQVITIEHVDKMITRLGKPEDMFEGETTNIPNDEPHTQKKESDSQYQHSARQQLFRDSVDKKLGGVCAGIAAYLNIDSLWVRLAFIILALVTKVFPIIVIYGVLWVLMPEAITATDRLKMKGTPINLETIGKTVSDTFNKATYAMKSDSIFERIIQGFMNIIVFCVKALLIFIGICFLPIAFVVLFIAVVLFLAAAGIIVSLPTWLVNSVTYIDWSHIHQYPGYTFALIFCTILAVGIPTYALVVGILQLVGSKVNINNAWKIFLFLLWIVVIIIGTGLLLAAPFFIPSGFEGLILSI